jgi:hypothetical protein
MAAPSDVPSRVVLDDVLSKELCRELICIARSYSVLGYRPEVASTTINDIAAASPAQKALVPLVRRPVSLLMHLVVRLLALTGFCCFYR